MGKELVKLCDSIKRYGLVDYEYGVWSSSLYFLPPLLSKYLSLAVFGFFYLLLIYPCMTFSQAKTLPKLVVLIRCLPKVSSMVALSTRTTLSSEELDTAIDSLKYLITNIPD